MDFFDLVNKRRSVRKFSNEKVPEEVILKSLRAALLAANSSNLQPWSIVCSCRIAQAPAVVSRLNCLCRSVNS